MGQETLYLLLGWSSGVLTWMVVSFGVNIFMRHSSQRHDIKMAGKLKEVVEKLPHPSTWHGEHSPMGFAVTNEKKKPFVQ